MTIILSFPKCSDRVPSDRVPSSGHRVPSNLHAFIPSGVRALPFGMRRQNVVAILLSYYDIFGRTGGYFEKLS
jgi:hypothetical protein